MVFGKFFDAHKYCERRDFANTFCRVNAGFQFAVARKRFAILDYRILLFLDALEQSVCGIRHEKIAQKFGRFVRVGVCGEISSVGKSDRARKSNLVANDFVRKSDQRSLYLFARFTEIFARDRLYPIFRAWFLPDWVIFGQAANCKS